ncbi:MAG: HAD family hydrolase [Clostridia bacterium]|nr:HAD family hydrolase [Clostridia bacterium]
MEKVIIFDLDGTLLDTIKDIADNVNLTLERFGYPTLTEKEIMTYIGNGARNLIRRSVKVELSDNAFEEVFRYYDALYSSSKSEKTCIFDGLDEVLIALKNKGYKLAILSNKQQAATDNVYEKYLKDYQFDMVVGQRDGVPIKPDPTEVKRILKTFNVLPENAYFVGDGDADVKVSLNAGINGISVLWGYREKRQLESVGAKVFAKTPSDLLDLIS